MSILKTLLGIPEKKPNGHNFGCGCSYCQNETQAFIASVHERRSRGVGGHTFLDVLLDTKEGRTLPPGKE